MTILPSNPQEETFVIWPLDSAKGLNSTMAFSCALSWTSVLTLPFKSNSLNFLNAEIPKVELSSLLPLSSSALPDAVKAEDLLLSDLSRFFANFQPSEASLNNTG